MTGWRPLSQREIGDVVSETLYEGVPAHLRDPVVHWLECQFWVPRSSHRNYDMTMLLEHVAGHARALRIASRLRVTLPAVKRDAHISSDASKSHLLGLLKLAEDADEAQLLDIVDAALAERDDPTVKRWSAEGKELQSPNSPADLDFILHDGGSAYRVNDQGNGLERRVQSTVREAVRRAADSSANSGSHLDAAWRAAYGIRPEPSVAYAEAVKAIEAAIIPVVVPDKPKATLAWVIRELRSTAAQWELSIADTYGAPAEVSSLLGLLELVWHGHRDRHAGTPTAMPVTAQAAEMAVHAAAMIVHWLGHGALRRRA